MKLGPGHHFGEWWGKGIQRNYARTEKIFSLFNTLRWTKVAPPPCCSIVPILYQGPFEDYGVMKGVKLALAALTAGGSYAAPGFMKPEGIMIYHHSARVYMKKTFEKDEKGKGE